MATHEYAAILKRRAPGSGICRVAMRAHDLEDMKRKLERQYSGRLWEVITINYMGK